MNTGGPRRRAAVGAAAAVFLAVLATACGGAAEAEGPDLPITEVRTVKGGAWQLEYAGESADSRFLDLAVVSDDEAWALSLDGGKGDGAENVLLRKEDGAWKPAPLPDGAEAGILMSHLEASAPDNVWLFWSGPEGQRAARWDGSEWAAIPSDPQAQFGHMDVAVIAPDDVWALSGRRSASHWDGKKWEAVKLPSAASAIDGRAADDVWAVGSTKPVEKDGGQPAAMHWDGESWETTKAPTYRFAKARPGERAALEAVTAVSGTEAWAIGTHNWDTESLDAEGIGDTFLLRWDGERWWKAPEAVGGDPRDFAGPKLRPVITGDGLGGAVLAGAQHWNGADEVRNLGLPKMPAKLLPEQPQKYDRHLRLSGLELLPRGQKVLGVGELLLGSEAEGAHSTRAVIVTYRLPR